MSEIVNASKVTFKEKVGLSPQFTVPEGVVGIEHVDVPVDDPQLVVEQEIEIGAETPFLLPPQKLNIVSQTVRFTGAGGQVVDVVLELDDVQGATDYDVRITKK